MVQVDADVELLVGVAERRKCLHFPKARDRMSGVFRRPFVDSAVAFRFGGSFFLTKIAQSFLDTSCAGFSIFFGIFARSSGVRDLSGA
jgi:hypothetical protein